MMNMNTQIRVIVNGEEKEVIYFQDYISSKTMRIHVRLDDHDVAYAKKVKRLSCLAKKVYCITTGETFNSISEACQKYNLDVGNLSKHCKGQYRSCGKIDGKKLYWRFI